MNNSAVSILRRNDPNCSEVDIKLLDNGNLDVELAQALSQNRFITKIRLFFFLAGTASNWNAMLHEIATRRNLNELILYRGVEAREGTRNHLALLLQFLRAAQRNQSIGSLELGSLRLSGEVSMVLATLTSLKSLSLNHCQMEEGDAQQLATVLQRSTTIQTLKLIHDRFFNMLPVLRCLPSNASIRHLVLGIYGGAAEESSRAMQHLFESTTAIESVEMSGYSSFFCRPVAEGLISSERVTKINLNFPITASGSALLVARILSEKQNLCSLSFQIYRFAGALLVPQLREALVAALLRPESSLRSLKISGTTFNRDSAFPGLRSCPGEQQT